MFGDELDLVQWLRRSAPAVSHGLIEIGDDMADVGGACGRLLIGTDMLLDGVHFDTRRHSYDRIGRKALACALSDCAAMAIRPQAATVSLALPSEMSMAECQSFFEGMFELAKLFEVAIVGGDTTRWSHPLAVDVTLVAAPYDGIEPVTRSGARVGDALFVTGPLGGSIVGRHMHFVPRIDEARRLAAHLGERLHAMMDISDGLSLDLWRMMQASQTGAVLEEQWLELAASNDARSLSADGTPIIEHVLCDGEDFELLLAVDGDITGCDVSLIQVGQVTGRGFRLRRLDGTTQPLKPKGFVH